MAEDEITQGELAALTRRFEETKVEHDREFGIVKSDLTALRLQVGNLDQKVDKLDQKVDKLDEKVDAFISEQRSVNAKLVELLANLVGNSPQ